MKSTPWFAAWPLIFLSIGPVEGGSWRGRHELEHLNQRIQGQIVDFTHNHGEDHRIWSEALQLKRDVYVYLPPNFDPEKKYPLIFWLHGYSQDEQIFVKYLVEPLDKAMATGKLPAAIVVAPDGSIDGYACKMKVGSFYLNSNAGNFEDYIMRDVWDFVMEHFPIRPEREAHCLTGVSMGGGGSFNLGIKYRDRVKIVAGIFPPVNTRYVDSRGRYMRPFDPEYEALRTKLTGIQIVGRFYGIFLIPLNRIISPIYDRRDPDAIAHLSRENPYEMIDAYDLKEGELSMFIGYGGKDQFNITAQVDSFLYKAKRKGLTVEVAFDPKGRHDFATAKKFFPCMVDWLRPQLEPYSPKP